MENALGREFRDLGVGVSVAARFAGAIVRARLPIVVGWIAVAVVMAVALPTLHEAQTGALGQLVPADSRALEAEELSAELFRFPLASRTVVAERDARGLPASRVIATGRLAADVNRGRVPGVRASGAYGVTNAVVGLPFARERGTTALSFLLFEPEFSQNKRLAGAHAYVKALDAPPSSFVGVTGAIPARAEQANLITEHLPLIELVTVALITLTVALYLRSLLAPLVTLLTVGVAYIVSVRLVAVIGTSVGVSVPPEVEPIMVALLFGVVTDYGLFYMSRFRRRLLAGEIPRAAARETAAELTPLILACGVAVAAGSAALGIANLGFLRAFGPGMALAVLVGLLVTITFLPAMLACVGRALLWPAPAREPSRHAVRAGWLDRLIVLAVRAPRRTTLVCLLMLGAMASGLIWLQVGNPLIRGLPRDSEPRRAYEQVSKGFAPGAVAPTTLVVTGPGIAQRREPLAALQQVLGDQPGVAGVVGPATNPSRQPFGLVISPSGDAVRYVMIAENDPLSADAVRLLRNLDARIADLLDVVGLPGSRALFAGDTAITSELIDTAGGDLLRVGPLVLLLVAIVLAVFLRALVAPAVPRAAGGARSARRAGPGRRRLPGTAGLPGAHLFRAAGGGRPARRAGLGLQHLPRRPHLERGGATPAQRGDRGGGQWRLARDHRRRPRALRLLRCARPDPRRHVPAARLRARRRPADRRLPRAHRAHPRGRRAGRRALELAEPPPRHASPDAPARTGGGTVRRDPCAGRRRHRPRHVTGTTRASPPAPVEPRGRSYGAAMAAIAIAAIGFLVRRGSPPPRFLSAGQSGTAPDLQGDWRSIVNRSRKTAESYWRSPWSKIDR